VIINVAMVLLQEIITVYWNELGIVKASMLEDYSRVVLKQLLAKLAVTPTHSSSLLLDFFISQLLLSSSSTSHHKR